MHNIALPVSKSLYIRQLFIHHLYFDELLAVTEDMPNDIRIVHRNLLIIRKNSMQKAASPAEGICINVQDCGAAFRFFLPLLCITPGHWRLTGTPRLLQRPIAPLILSLKQLNNNIIQKEDGILIQGKNLTFSTLAIEATESSQFISALLLIAPKIHCSTLQIIHFPKTSNSYINLTIKLLQSYHIHIELIGKEYRLVGTPHSTPHFAAEQDWSAAAYWYAVAALTGETFHLTGLHLHSLQPDAAIAEKALSCWNVGTQESATGVQIARQKTCPSQTEIHWDCRETPDLIPLIAVMAILTVNDYHIEGCESLNLKESKRLDLLRDTLSAFVQTETTPDEHWLHVFGTRSAPDNPLRTTGKAIRLSAHNDHRLVMAYSLFRLFHSVEIEDFASVKKSYPQFQSYQNAIAYALPL